MNRRKVQVIAFILLVLPMMPLTALGQGEHSLEWGVDVGEEFTYVLQRKVGDQVGFDYIAAIVPFIQFLDEGQKMFANITLLEDIPSEINSPFDEPRSYCNLIRENDSVVIVAGSNGFAVPVSDWSFIANLRNITTEFGYTIIDTEDEWGYYASGLYPGSSDVNVYQELRYEKENGTLRYYRWAFTQYSSTLLEIILVQWYPGVPTVLPPGINLSVILLAAIGICLAAVCCFLTYRGFKQRRTTVMEKLGK